VEDSEVTAEAPALAVVLAMIALVAVAFGLLVSLF
jgi:hypothetical protein